MLISTTVCSRCVAPSSAHPGWYRSGQDVERRLPVLSTYLGHVHVSDTYWYLSAHPELMTLAMTRLEQRWVGRP